MPTEELTFTRRKGLLTYRLKGGKMTKVELLKHLAKKSGWAWNSLPGWVFQGFWVTDNIRLRHQTKGPVNRQALLVKSRLDFE